MPPEHIRLSVRTVVCCLCTCIDLTVSSETKTATEHANTHANTALPRRRYCALVFGTLRPSWRGRRRHPVSGRAGAQPARHAWAFSMSDRGPTKPTRTPIPRTLQSLRGTQEVHRTRRLGSYIHTTKSFPHENAPRQGGWQRSTGRCTKQSRGAYQHTSRAQDTCSAVHRSSKSEHDPHPRIVTVS
jgi:hypothetical protein